VALVGTRLYVALDARSATVAAVAGGIAGRRLRAFARVPLAAGAIVPSASATNIPQPDAAREAIRSAVDGVGWRGRATLVLPGGLTRLALLSLPAGARARDFVQFRLAPTLPWPAGESIVDVLRLARGRVIGAAVHRAAVAEHEQALRAAGLEVDRVHLAPLLAAQGLARSGPRDVVHAVLDDTSVCLLALRDGAIAALRSRRRDASPGEAERLVAEAARTAQLAANGRTRELPVAFSGADAILLRREAQASGSAGERTAGVLAAGHDGAFGAAIDRWSGAAEAAWLGGVLR